VYFANFVVVHSYAAIRCCQLKGRSDTMFNTVDYEMVNVSDMQRSVAIYRDVLGLRLKFESPEWSEFETGDTTLALHAATPVAESGAATTRPRPIAGTCSICFLVRDLNSAILDLQKRGAYFVVPPIEQPNEGIRLAVCVDPDGLAISFAERMTHEG
jgi:lactoylglutathione lyase